MKLKEIQHLYLPSYLQRLIPNGELKGHEFIAGDIDGNPGRSFSFNVNKGVGKDFSTGEVFTIVSLVAKIYNTSTKEAYKKIIREWGLNTALTVTPKKKKPKENIILPVPASAPALKVSAFHGTPVAIWDYRSKNNELLFHVVRFEKDGQKDYRPYSFTDNGWKPIAPEAPRPLYNLPHFKKGKNYVIVEGEKAADAAQKLCPWGVATTWPNGAEAVDKADWSLLAGEKVIIWRDADPINPKTGKRAGEVAQEKLCKALSKHGCDIRVLKDEFYASKPDGWDAADALEDGLTIQELQDLLKANLVEYKESQFGSSEKVASQVTETKTASEPITEPLNRYYRVLGLVGNMFAFYNYTAGIVCLEKHGGLSKKFFLSLTNGDSDYWKDAYGYEDDDGNRKINWDAVAGSLMGECNHIGQFDIDTMRGVGAWRDKNRIVVNAGRWLYIDGKKVAIDKFDSDYLYQKSGEILHSIDNPLTKAERIKFAELCDMFSWEHEVSGRLLAGWMMIAPICGCLGWRPHIYICGMAGTGKSTIYRQILSKGLGKFKRAYLGDTTEAGVRQRGSNDSLPAIFDEFETDGKQSADRIERIIRLFRMCSDAHDGRLYKGSQDQSKAVSYTVQSAGCFSSITPSVKHFADITRITTLALKTEHGMERERKENFKKVEAVMSELITDTFSERFIAYAILNAHKIIKSWEAFKEAASMKQDFSARIADQIGMLMAGAWMYKHDNPCTIEQASEILNRFEWEELVPNKGHQNQSRLLRTIAQATFDIDNEDKLQPRKYGRNIGTMVEYLAHEYLNDFDKGHPDGKYFTPDVVRTFLCNKGIIVEDGYVFFANSSEGLSRILYNTQWQTDWKTTLKAIKGAIIPPTTKYYGAGIGSIRSTGIPVNTFLDNAENPDNS